MRRWGAGLSMSSNREMVSKAIDFMRAVLLPADAGQSAEQFKSVVFAFRQDLSDFNADASNPLTRPFMLLQRENDSTLDEMTLTKVLMVARRNGLAGEFYRVVHQGHVVCLFSHKARPLVDALLSKLPVGYGNLDSSGLALDDFQFMGFYTASEERLRDGLLQAEQYIKLH